ncbi:MAG: T9SS type A sorting domain-containing protein [Psychroserpens sp.]|nr:T9SS type A sorting domain-containing protein [Psychroserpens sp.]
MKSKMPHINSYSIRTFVITFLLATTPLFSQSVTNVYPLRVTTGSVVTIEGTGFTPDLANNSSSPFIVVNGGGMDIKNRTFINPTLITFEIGRTNKKTNNIENPLAATPADISRELVVNGTSTGFILDYIAPTKRIHRINGNGNIARVEEIYTDWNGFWRSNFGTQPGSPVGAANEPDDSHNLLGFKYEGVIYSTGVNDVLLTSSLPNETDNVPNLEYVPQNFKAYSTNGVQALTQNSHHIYTGDRVDGIENEGAFTFINNNIESIQGLNMYEVLVDGINGLNLGTGVNNLNSNTTIRFFSGNGQAGTVAQDNIPDLLITNMAEAGKADVYSYADIDGNIIGRPVSVLINNSDVNNPGLSEWDQDQYRVTIGVSFDQAIPTRRIYGSHQKRPMRVVAFKLSEFGINDDTIINDPIWSIESINNINVAAGGSADPAFFAYNTGAFEIKSPIIIERPISRAICRLPSTIDVSFEVEAAIDGIPSDPSVNPLEAAKEQLHYQWYKYNSKIIGEVSDNLTLTDVTASDLGLYELVVSNSYGSTIVQVNLTEGGTPSFWNGTSWQLPEGFITEAEALTNPSAALDNVIVPNKDRRLIFSDDYNQNSDLEGCDCIVSAGSQVSIPAGKTLSLYGDINVSPSLDIINYEDGTISETISAGQIIIEDDASLVQIKPVTTNTNSGPIQLQREASNLHLYDYVYWSSPVESFNISGISNTPTFQWDVNAINANGSNGNWISASNSIMEIGRGYIVRVPSAENFTTNFIGRPNNGEILKWVSKTNVSQDADDSHWNLIGNPYPSAINANTFLAANSRIDGNIRIWMHNNPIAAAPNPSENPFYENFTYNYGDQYVTHNATGSTPSGLFDGNIAAGQGFFVQVMDNQNSGNVTFKNNMRFDGSEVPYDNSEFFRLSSEMSTNYDTQDEEKQLIWLSLLDGNNSAVSTLVGYLHGATNGRDRLYDASHGLIDFSVYSLINDDEMTIQGRSLPFNSDDQVPIGINIQENDIYTLAIDTLEGSLFVDELQGIFIEDLYLNIVHDLRESPYTFVGNSGITNDRFLLRFNNNETLAMNDVAISEILTFIKNGTFVVDAGQKISDITIFDVTGKTVVEYKVDASSSRFTSSFNFAKGVYVATITLNDGVVVSKKLIN